MNKENKNNNIYLGEKFLEKTIISNEQNSVVFGGGEGEKIGVEDIMAKATLIGERENFQDKKILYIYPVYGGTYQVISQGITESLKQLVSEVYTASAKQDVAKIAAQIMPDLVLVLLGDSVPIEQVKTIRSMGIKTAVWFTDDPYVTDMTKNIAPFYHYVFTQELSCVSYYQLLGCPQVHYLPLAVNTKVFHPNSEANSLQHVDVCFMGTAWNNRITLFDQIAPDLSNKNTLIVGRYWQRMKNYHLLSDKIRLTVLSPGESALLMKQSKIVINNHRAYDDNTLFSKNSNKLPAFSINPRTFEISARGPFNLQIFDKSYQDIMK